MADETNPTAPKPMPSSPATNMSSISEGPAVPPPGPVPNRADSVLGSDSGNVPPVPGQSIIDNSPDVQPFITDDARAAAGEVELIGGYVKEVDSVRKVLRWAQVREMTGHEEDMLGNAKISMNRRLNHIVASCLVRIGDGEGTYVTGADEMWGVVDALPAADRFLLLVFIRILSVGEDYTFQLNCPGCGFMLRKKVELYKLPRMAMPDQLRRVYDVDLSTGKKVRCRIMLGIHEEQVVEAQELGQNQLSAAILARVLEINGKPANMNAVKSLTTRERNELRTAFEKHEGGIEMSTSMNCGKCGIQFDVDIEVGQKDFFFPAALSSNLNMSAST